MSAELTHKEILLRLMDKMDHISEKQSEHSQKLDSIETQAFKTNGRVTKVEEEIDAIQIKQENMAVKVGAGVFMATIVVSFLFNKIL